MYSVNQSKISPEVSFNLTLFGCWKTSLFRVDRKLQFLMLGGIEMLKCLCRFVCPATSVETVVHLVQVGSAGSP